MKSTTKELRSKALQEAKASVIILWFNYDLFKEGIEFFLVEYRQELDWSSKIRMEYANVVTVQHDDREHFFTVIRE